MREACLVLNAGSSSLKFSLYSFADHQLSNKPIIYGQFEALDEKPHFIAKDYHDNILINEALVKNKQKNLQQFALTYLLDWLRSKVNDYKIVAAGHRVVHGGDIFTTPVVVNEAIIQQLIELNPLAPLHQPYNIAGIQALNEYLPTIFQVACFDTSFHTTQSPIAQAFALPENISRHPIKRYGFHGISYEYIAHVLPDYLDSAKLNGNIIVAHLGRGASLCAMQNRRSIATTMGFTALDGLPMGTRCGNLDPGVILYLLAQQGMSVDEITHLLYAKSGLLGISGISADVRELLASKNPNAKKALDLFVYWVVREIGSLTAALCGLGAIIFTAGIGENASEIRAAVCQQLAWLGVKLDQEANAKNNIMISAAASNISVFVIPTNEELMIAQHTCNLFYNSVAV